MIEVNGLKFSHKGSGSEALRGITFSIPKGALVCLTGENGSGKSTLLALLAGVFAPESGKLDIRVPEKRKARVGLVPQDPELYILGSLVEEDLLLGLDPKDEAARGRALKLARRFSLEDQLGQAVHKLSYGQKKKLSLASALAAEPDLLLLDEPFAGLDYPSSLAMREALQKNKELGLTQIVCEHNLDLVADLADSYLLLSKGELISSGTADQVYPLMGNNGVRPPCSWFIGGSTPVWQG